MHESVQTIQPNSLHRSLPLQGNDGNYTNSSNHWLVQFLSLKDLHLSIGHGRAAAAGCLPLRSPIWGLCTHIGVLKKIIELQFEITVLQFL